MNLHEFREDIISGKISVEDIPDRDLMELRNLCSKYTKIPCCTHGELAEYKNLIMILLDYYTYHSEGNVIISDYDYDQLMINYSMNGGTPISNPDNIKDDVQTRWDFVEHECPGIVGTVKKMYDDAEVYSWWEKASKKHETFTFRIAPKYDGISSAIKISSKGKLIMAVTRNDGYKGQDITKVIEKANNIKDILKCFKKLIKSDGYLWIKTELVMTTESFEKCIEEKEYANRRSATSGIVNSPKNLHLAKYIDIIPLAIYNPQSGGFIYKPHKSYITKAIHPGELLNEIKVLLSVIRDAKFPYRTDGVVIFPVLCIHGMETNVVANRSDFMDDAIAYKSNTNEAFTTVDYGYVSVGPLGYARPMLHVQPVEVNETCVQDVSLGSFDTFAAMDLHEKEQVIIYSAGDVIPQAKIPEDRHYPKKAKLIEIPMVCPHCNEWLNRNKGIYRCENEKCPRVNQGRIINFISKLKVKDVSDATIEDLYNANLIKTIPDIFKLSKKDIKSMEGYQDGKADIIIGEFDRIKTKETTISEFLGALGIKGISVKKCRKIIENIGDYKRLFEIDHKKLFKELIYKNGIGEKTATEFIDFLSNNKDLISNLSEIMNITDDYAYKGNIVFTGFRDKELEEEILNKGYEVSENLNKSTVLLINASYNNDSTKCKAAIERGINIVHRSKAKNAIAKLAD